MPVVSTTKMTARHYWILDPSKRSLEGFELDAAQYRVAGMGQNDEEITLPPFPNLVIPLKKLWFPNV